MTTTSSTTALVHEGYCLPRPGYTEPRIETFTVRRTGPDGTTILGYARVTRCQECGAQTVSG